MTIDRDCRNFNTIFTDDINVTVSANGFIRLTFREQSYDTNEPKEVIVHASFVIPLPVALGMAQIIQDLRPRPDAAWENYRKES